jgi:hypothetical protein
MVVIMALMSNAYAYVFNKWIDSGYQKEMQIELADKMELFLYEKGASDKEVDKQKNRMLEQPIRSAEKTAAFGLVRFLAFGVIFSLIAAAMVKKNPDPFSGIPDAEEV